MTLVLPWRLIKGEYDAVVAIQNNLVFVISSSGIDGAVVKYSARNRYQVRISILAQIDVFLIGSLSSCKAATSYVGY